VLTASSQGFYSLMDYIRALDDSNSLSDENEERLQLNLILGLILHSIASFVFSWDLWNY